MILAVSDVKLGAFVARLAMKHKLASNRLKARMKMNEVEIKGELLVNCAWCLKECPEFGLVVSRLDSSRLSHWICDVHMREQLGLLEFHL
jgi:Pyruvate/2-oxoacid:ferredoxin oxidoreductase delta subunit